MRIVHWTCCTGVTATRQAVILAMGLTNVSPAGIEDTLHHSGIDIWNIAFERRGTVHHRHTGEHDVVLQHHGLALQLSAGCPFDHTLDVPSIVLVFLALWTI